MTTFETPNPGSLPPPMGPPTMAPPPMAPHRDASDPTLKRNARTRPVATFAKAAQLAVGVSMLAQVIALPLAVRFIGALNGANAGTTRFSEVLAVERQYLFGAFAAQLLFLAAGVASSTWLYRISKNAEALRPGEIDHKPKWAIIGWLIPFLWFVRPLHMMQQAWQTGRVRYPTSPIPSRIGQWWACFVGSFVIGRVANGMAASSLTNALWVEIASAIAVVGAGALFILLIREITERQQALIDSLGSSAGFASPSPWGEVPQMPTDFTPVMPSTHHGIVTERE